MIKYGVVLDRELFAFLESHTKELLDREPRQLLHVIKRSCQLKASVVEQDEREAGLRAVLNYGHTLGHAVESLTGYGCFKHGEAVAIGMVQAARISAHLGYCTRDDVERISALLKALALPVELPGFSPADYTAALLHDKKVRDGGLTFVFNRGIGDFELARMTDIPDLLKICGIGG